MRLRLGNLRWHCLHSRINCADKSCVSWGLVFAGRAGFMNQQPLSWCSETVTRVVWTYDTCRCTRRTSSSWLTPVVTCMCAVPRVDLVSVLLTSVTTDVWPASAAAVPRQLPPYSTSLAGTTTPTISCLTETTWPEVQRSTWSASQCPHKSSASSSLLTVILT